MRITRRGLLLGGSALAAAATREQTQTLESPALDFRIAITDGKVASRRFTNRLSNETVSLPAEDFELEFLDGPVLNPASFKLQATAKANRIKLLYTSHEYHVRVEYEMPEGKPYFRKRIFLRASGGSPRRLVRADLDNWRGVYRNWDSPHVNPDAHPYGSHPIFCEDLWAGVEFIAAFNRHGKDGFLLRSRPGGVRIGTEWVALRPTVAGVSEPGRVRDAFLSYIDDIRLTPPRYVACYNSWWTLPKQIQQSDYLALMRNLKEVLYDRHGVFFDLVATDAGWSDKQSIWQIDRQQLPNGFADMRAIVESAGAKAGLWISPSEMYKPNFDYDWARKNGYIVLKDKDTAGFQWEQGVSLADPSYREEAKRQLQKLVRDNNFEHIKFDGFVCREEEGHHDLLPGDDSVEPLAEYSLELLDAAKAANPRLVTEPTYLNNIYNYFSPWQIQHSDTMWGNSGGDCPAGMWPAPDYRESDTNAPQYYIFRSMSEFWLPQNAVQYFDIVHCDDEAGFPNHAAMAFGRGRFFLCNNINPKYMRDDDWRLYAGLLKWGRQNTGIMRNTTVLPSRIDLGEPYLYAHWLGTRGILAVRNPSNETQEHPVDLRKAGAPESLRDGVCYTQFPYRKGLAAGLSGRSEIRIQLAPWELLFLEVRPRGELNEPVVLGARWNRDARGCMLVAAERTPQMARLIDPAGGDCEIALPSRSGERLAAEVLLESLKKLGSGIQVELEYQIVAPADAARNQVLLLVEWPGRRAWPSQFSATLNGAPVTLNQSMAKRHIGAFLSRLNTPWEDVAMFESRWTWYTAEVGPGTSRIRFSGSSGFAQTRLRTWAWAEWDLSRNAVAIDVPCPEAAMPQYRNNLERHGIKVGRA